MSSAPTTSSASASASTADAASSTPASAATSASTLTRPDFAWSEGPFANGTGPNSLPVLDPASLPPRSFPLALPFPPLKNDLFLRTARGEQGLERTPIWCHRQAGRYLPEFRETRKLGDFFTMCRTPRIAVELTLQPIRRFSLDAAIIFSDILVIPQALGMEVLMQTGVGPVLPSPIRTPEDMKRLKKKEEVDIESSLGYVFDAIYLCRHSLQGTVPLIGFCGAPWTLMCYMIEGGGAKSYTLPRRWLYAHPEESKQFLQLITDVLVDYLVGQVLAGAQALEVFDTWSGELSEDAWLEFILPCLKQIAAQVKSKVKEKGLEPVPMTLFPRGSDYCLTAVATQTCFDVISLDWSTSASMARRTLDQAANAASTPSSSSASPSSATTVAPRSIPLTLQGNLDPAVLYAPPEYIRRATRQMLDAFNVVNPSKPGRLIANLGHGMLPDHPVEGLRVFIDEVHNYSEKIMKQRKE